eukprot:11418-Heterococcus_DN1.PRE.1
MHMRTSSLRTEASAYADLTDVWPLGVRAPCHVNYNDKAPATEQLQCAEVIEGGHINIVQGHGTAEPLPPYRWRLMCK